MHSCIKIKLKKKKKNKYNVEVYKEIEIGGF